MKTNPLSLALRCLVLPSFALSAPASPAIIPPRISNLAVSTPGSITADNNVACTGDPAWFAGYPPNKADCVAAIHNMREEYEGYGAIPIEFVAPGIMPFRSPALITPVRYQSGSCEAALVMTEAFRPRTLPGPAGSITRRLRRDLTNFGRLFFGADKIVGTCIDTQQYGWYAAGQYGLSIGFFLWAVDSTMAQSVFGLHLSSNTTGRS